jgi:hypothetical protein
MATTAVKTPGQALAARLRYYLSIGPRTRRYRKGDDLHRAMIEALNYAATQPGYHTEATQDALAPGFPAALSWEKHILGCRASSSVVAAVNAMSPWRFAGLLGRMVDAGVSCTGDGERFFREMRDQ